MAFYIKPPEGNLSLRKLHQDAEIRLKFLYQMHQDLDGEGNVKITGNFRSLALHSECIIEGSLRDRISHFILRYACINSSSFQTFLTKAETCLFQCRLLTAGHSAAEKILRNLLRHVSYALRHQALSFHHRALLEQIQEVVPDILGSGMLECSDRKSCHHIIKVPWTMVDALVSDRSVVVVLGEVDIPCILLTRFLCTIFQSTLTYGIGELLLRADSEKFDARITYIKRSLRRLFSSKFGGYSNLRAPYTLSHKDIEQESELFPACMRQLHQALRETNRLRHHARFRYTLFLKDIGLSLNENMAFWEHYYSKPLKGAVSSCCHSWSGSDSSRYKYSIRHVYGLEGRRINYSSHSCSALQALTPQPSEARGCPFDGDDYDEIFSILKSLYGDGPFLTKVMALVMKNKPNSACKLLMKHSLASFGISSRPQSLDPEKDSQAESDSEKIYSVRDKYVADRDAVNKNNCSLRVSFKEDGDDANRSTGKINGNFGHNEMNRCCGGNNLDIVNGNHTSNERKKHCGSNGIDIHVISGDMSNNGKRRRCEYDDLSIVGNGDLCNDVRTKHCESNHLGVINENIDSNNRKREGGEINFHGSIANLKRTDDCRQDHGALPTSNCVNNKVQNSPCVNCSLDRQDSSDSVCDIEDISFLANFDFCKPSQYYLYAKSKVQIGANIS